MKNICIFGDSVAKGVVYDEARSKYVFLKNCFVNMFAQKANLPVKNYARFGCTVEKGIEIINRHRDELLSFSHTVLEFGGNDCNLNWREISCSPHETHLPEVPLQQFKETYLKIINIIKSAGSTPVILSLPPLEPEKFFKWVSQGLNRENILKFIGEIDAIYRWQESYDTAVKNLAKIHAIRLVDIRDAFLKEGAYSDFICRDGMHPNEKGHALIHKLIEQQVLLPLRLNHQK